MPHPALQPGNAAVVTGGASGIGLAAAARFLARGMAVCIADLGEDRLAAAARSLLAAAPDAADRVMTMQADVSQPDAIVALRDAVSARFGGTDVLMNNAGVHGTTMFGADEIWERVVAVNLMGIVRGCRSFAPGMIARGRPGLIINTGSKQGITLPPGDPVYNMAKAGVKAFTELLQHELRNTPGCQVSAHLLIPGFVFTPLTAGERTSKPDAAWTPDQAADFMMAGLDAGDFYILCPDNDVDRATDEKRILWSANDIVANRPPLSRWHPDYKAAFDAFMR